MRTDGPVSETGDHSTGPQPMSPTPPPLSAAQVATVVTALADLEEQACRQRRSERSTVRCARPWANSGRTASSLGRWSARQSRTRLATAVGTLEEELLQWSAAEEQVRQHLSIEDHRFSLPSTPFTHQENSIKSVELDRLSGRDRSRTR
jgi:hypothetical protein